MIGKGMILVVGDGNVVFKIELLEERTVSRVHDPGPRVLAAEKRPR